MYTSSRAASACNADFNGGLSSAERLIDHMEFQMMALFDNLRLTLWEFVFDVCRN